jgi:apolipoprotein N-acyltransferase
MKSRRQSFVWLAIGAMLMLFSNGRWIIPFATWLYPIFFLRFMCMQKPGSGFIFLALASAIINTAMWWKMIPFPLTIYLILTCIAMQIFTLCFLTDRLLTTRLKGFLSTLVFPVAWCSLEYLLSLTSKGTWNSLAYTQAGNLPLMQLASVTGIWGVTFLITWFASVINWVWQQNFEWEKIRKGTISFASVAVAILLFGTIRLNFFSSPSQTIRTASIVQARNINEDLKTCKWTDAKGINQYSNEVENNLLDKTQQAAQAGAKIILWQESAGFIPKQEENEFVKRAMALAAQEKIYLLMTLWSVPEDFPKHLVENKLIIIDTNGREQLTYIKNNPAPPEPIIKGDGLIPTLQTSYGKIAPAICADADYAGFIRQAGKNKVDIMFIPANDWKEIDPLHTHMAVIACH